VAADILSRAAAELSAAATSVITRLEMRGDVFPTILSGGIFHVLPSLAADVVQRLLDIAPRAATRVLDIEPAVGAVHLALAAARGPVTLPTYI